MKTSIHVQDGNEVFFRIKRSTQLKKLMNAYCDRQSVEFNAIAFLFDGRRLRAEQTPDEVLIVSTSTHPKQAVCLLFCMVMRCLTSLCFAFSAWDGRWRRDWCYASPNRWLWYHMISCRQWVFMDIVISNSW